MIPLNARGTPHRISASMLGKVITSANGADDPRRRVLAVSGWSPAVSGARVQAVLCAEPLSVDQLSEMRVPAVHGIAVSHLAEGDVVRIDHTGEVRTLYRRASRQNTLFATDRCNSLCLMCSQPPRNVDDHWRVQEMLDLIDLLDPETSALGITGGEPTLLKDDLLRVVVACKDRLPRTALHMLSNGRLFRYGSFARRLAAIAHPDLMVGVPIYSDLDEQHDYVVQARGAFDQSMIGLQNLGRFGVPVEIRVVIHQHTYRRLPEIAEFIYRNLTFAAHVALMGLELMGFAVANEQTLWLDPRTYRAELEAATLFLAERGMKVSVYNHQLCVVPETIWPYCRKSISDWKNDYLPDCDACHVRQSCGGFFTSTLRHHSEHIRPLSA